MDEESWILGYLTGVGLHSKLRTPQIFPSVIASLSVSDADGDIDWFVDLSGAESLTKITVDYVGNVTASYSYDGQSYTNPVPVAELLAVNPAQLFEALPSDAPYLYFRFHLVGRRAGFSGAALWGVLSENIPWNADASS